MTQSTFRTVLVPLDGSAFAEQALLVAAKLAKPSGACLHVVMVAPPASVMARDQPGSGATAMTVPELEEGLGQYLATATEAISTTHGVRATWALLHGWPPTSLATYARHHQIDLIVMTTHGRGGVSRFWLGRVADQLLRSATAPVLLFRPGHTPPTDFHRILLALDGSAVSESALGPALALALLTQESRIAVAQVVEAPSLTPSQWLIPTLVPPERTEAERKAAAAKLEQLARRIREGGLPVEVKVVTGASVAEAILELARTEGSDLIVVGTHGTGGVKRLLLGSVADKVVRGATLPVLVVPVKARQVRRRPSRAGRAENLAAGSVD